MTKLDGMLLRQMIISGANNLFNYYPEVDALNVFPVPDGDTGTNMNLTLSSGAKMVAECPSNDIYSVAKAFSQGLLDGAHGNSGVIISTIFRGFAQSLKGKVEADAMDVAEAFLVGKDIAYKVVEKPVEGTMLTVEREAAQALYDKVEPGMPIDEAMDIFYKEACASLQRTPNLLPILKEVGVVDSGGAGFCRVIEGFAKALHNQIVEKKMASVVNPEKPIVTAHVPFDNVQSHLKHEDFGYCTEFLMELPADPAKGGKSKFDENRFRSILATYGNSLVAVRDEDLVKVHVHTKKPGSVLNFAQQFGEFKRIKIESMTQQHQHLIDEANGKVAPDADAAPLKREPMKESAMVAVCAGDGIAKLFKDEIGVAQIIPGGQTMNPATSDIVAACRAANAKNVFVFPNNGNIIMTASAAADILQDEGINVIVVPSKTIPEGMVAAMMFTPSVSPESNKTEMVEAMSQVKSGEVTYAIRSTSVNGVSVKKGQFMGMHGKKIANVSDDKFACLYGLLDSMVTSESSIINVICGQDIDEQQRQEISAKLNEKYGKTCEGVDVRDGGQPVYSFIVSVE